MRIGNLSDRLVLFVDDGAVDVEQASDGRFESDPQQVFGRWAEFVEWATTATLPAASLRAEQARRPRSTAAATVRLRAQLPLARYRDRLGYARRTRSLHQVRLLDHWPVRRNHPSPGQHWEVELVVVIGKGGTSIAPEQAWDHIARRDQSARTCPSASASWPGSRRSSVSASRFPASPPWVHGWSRRTSCHSPMI